MPAPRKTMPVKNQNQLVKQIADKKQRMPRIINILPAPAVFSAFCQKASNRRSGVGKKKFADMIPMPPLTTSRIVCYNSYIKISLKYSVHSRNFLQILEK